MIKFFAGVVVVLGVVSVVAVMVGLAVDVWISNIDELRLAFPMFKKDPMDYRRGYEEGRAYTAKYPMGIYTFPVACSHCANLGSDKCHRCKEERESGFVMKKEGDVV